METYVQLDRQFSPIPKSIEEAESEEILSSWGHGKVKSWEDLDAEYRCVILAEAGAGKTEELRQRARALADRGKAAFFVRIEEIQSDYYQAFEVGEEKQFLAWLESTDEAWFFLDSVDEARLENPRTFEIALRTFTKSIRKGAHRAHIYISSRPYAWRPREDRGLVDSLLFYPEQNNGQREGLKQKPKSALTVFVLRPLDEGRVRCFCEKMNVPNINKLIREIERANLWSMAERPFDLEGVVAKWCEDGELGGRLELLRHNIVKRLRDDHDSIRAQRQSLNLEKALQGARRLAAAVILTGKAGVNVPGAVQAKPGIDAETVLSDWELEDVRTLLERGIFNDVIYGAVRFRHRDVRELLAAEWFEELIRAGGSRCAIEGLFFREMYGQNIVSPRLRPILPWLILFDSNILRRSLQIHPEIAVEGGDPSRLPLPERQRILKEIVIRIASNQDSRSARENSAIAKIANNDLAADVGKLVNELKGNDDAIFFLGRLVWLGEMTTCLSPLATIAADSARDIYARIASARAVMTCGSPEQQKRLWEQINYNNDHIQRRLLAELVEEAMPDSDNVAQVLISLGKLQPYERFEVNALGHSLDKYITRLPVIGDQLITSELLYGLHDYLVRPPYVERRECKISEEYRWLLPHAIHVIERLVKARSSLVLGNMSLSIMLMVPMLRFWREFELDKRKSNLKELVSAWPELNDALYWASIEQARDKKMAKSGERLTDDWSVSWHSHFWNFDVASLPRLLNYVYSRPLQDDRQVALSTAFRIFVQAGRQENIHNSLKAAVVNNPILEKQLKSLLNPQKAESVQKYEKEQAEYERKQKKDEDRKKQNREEWIAALKANPELVRTPPELEPGEWTNYQYWLMAEIRDGGLATSRTEGANWQALIPDFGEAVAQVYRDAAMKHWRQYKPTLQSEGDIRDNTVQGSLIFALAGLEIEAAEVSSFPHHLNEKEVSLALRYITWDINGFPSWLERIHQAFPVMVNTAVVQELLWEVENTGSDQSMHYILSNLVCYAPWLHQSIAPALLDWIEANPARFNTSRDYCLNILLNGGSDPDRLLAVAIREIRQNADPAIISWWYALLVDCDPVRGVTELEQWLSSLDWEVATHAAQIFATALMGSRSSRASGAYVGRFRKAEYLKSLYILMHRYIPAKDDINRAGGGVYSPGLRDDAQDARNSLFKQLSEIRGKASYVALTELADEHPDSDYRPWMAERAYKRAEEDGDLEPWTPEQISNFARTQTLKPATHRQLYDLSNARLYDMKNWLERGNDSPYKTWQRVEDENELRVLIAGWLNQQRQNQYVTAQEPELANNQRMDIWLQNPDAMSPVPIELKLLDKGWSGPKLCERLRNQLAGDYLREESAGCGVMLLAWKGILPERRWKINGKNVRLTELADSLKSFWEGISGNFPNVESINVIMIDLGMREKASKT